MNTLRYAIKTATAFLMTQEVIASKSYRRISFCFIEDIDGVHVAYNALTGEIAELEEWEYQTLSADTVMPSEETKELIEKWFLVPTDNDDIQLCDGVRDLVSVFNKENGIHAYTIFTTMDCNARCFYCYEMGRPRVYMSEEVALKTAEFIKSNYKDKPVKLTWFGGEPLCNTKVIDIITDSLIEAGVEFKSSAVSNGFLFDQDIVDKAVGKWNVKKVQITLDGTQDVYNKAKAYVDAKDKNPFSVVTDNIEKLLKKGVCVSVRMNMGAHNKDDLFKLVDWLSERYKGMDGLYVYPHLLFATDFSVPIDEEAELALAKDMVALQKYCRDKNLLSIGKLDEEVKITKCMADSSSSITVTPLGNIGKCEHFSENEFVGNLDTGINDFGKIEEFKKKINSAELCAKCPMYPICIELEKCPDKGRYGCSLSNRYIQHENVRLRIRNAYKKLKESK